MLVMHAILRISGSETSRPTTSPKADYTTLKCYKAPSRLKQALAFPTKFSFCIQQGNIAFQNDISQKPREIGSLVVRS